MGNTICYSFVQLQPFIVYIARRGVVAVIVKMLKLQAQLNDARPARPKLFCRARQGEERVRGVVSEREIQCIYVLMFFACNVINALNNSSSIPRDFAFI